MFIIILLEVLKKFNFTIDIYNLDQFIKTLKSQLHKNQVLEQDEEERMFDLATLNRTQKITMLKLVKSENKNEKK